MADAGFSDDGKYFSTISSDGRLRIWDTETNVLKQEYTPDLHLTSPPTCLQWICASQSSVVSALTNKWQDRTNQGTRSLVALGTKSGKILVYCVSSAKVVLVLVEGGAGAATALDWRPPYGLYSCHAHNALLHWDLDKATLTHKYTVGERKSKADSISAIKIVPHNQEPDSCYIVTAATLVVLWRLHGGSATPVLRLGQRNAAHQALLSLAVLDQAAWLILGSRSERLLYVYEVTIKAEYATAGAEGVDTPQSKRRKHSAPSAAPHYAAVLEAAPRTLHAHAQQADGVLLNIAAAISSGCVHYYSHVLNGASPKPLKPSVTIQMASEDAEPLPVTACRLTQHHITLAYTKHTQLAFENVIPDLKTKTQILVHGGETEGRREGNKKRGVKEKGRSKEESKERPDEINVLEPMGGVVRKRGVAADKVEVAMEQRLANLSMRAGARERSRGAPAHSLARLLVQGLQSEDDKLVSCVLERHEAATALQTVAALPPAAVPALLRRLADRADTSTQRCASVCVWTAAVLQHEAALLLGAADAAAHLARLLATFTHRRSHLCQLLALRGRLQLTSRQRPRDSEPQPSILHYNDDTCSESEMELDADQERPSDSEEEWGEEGDDDSGGEGDQGD